MKLLNKVTLVSVLGCAAVVGTGFAAWTFNANANAQSQANVLITSTASVGTLAASKTQLYVVLDQAGAYFSTKNDEATALANKVTSITLTYTGSEDAADVSDVSIAFSKVVTADLETYVTVGDGALGTPSVTKNVKTVEFTLPTLTYTAEKPTTIVEYNAMKTAVADDTIAFSFTATVAE